MMNNGKIKTAALHNLGCKVNAYETEAMEQQLVGADIRSWIFTSRRMSMW